MLAYRYEGLRKEDFYLVMRHLKDEMDDEAGLTNSVTPVNASNSGFCVLARLSVGAKRKNELRSMLNNKRRLSGGGAGIDLVAVKAELDKTREQEVDNNSQSVNIFCNVFAHEDDLIWPLQLVDEHDHEQFKVLCPLLTKLPHVVMHYLNELIFPEVLAHQGLKLSTCGQELGGDILFGRRIGFSGTPSDILPVELGSCNYERGSDGRMVHYLTNTSVVRHEIMQHGWNVFSILDYAKADPPFHALIDTGALITGLSNKAVAEYLLQTGLAGMQGSSLLG